MVVRGGGLVRTDRNRGRTEPPPDGWFEAGFDDSGWPVERMPYNTAHLVNFYGSTCRPNIRQTCLRTRFIVPDPGKVKKLVFTSVFHGGLIVRVNGREVARKHILSDGIFAKEGYAEPYPEMSYGPVTDEMKKLARKAKAARNRREGVAWSWRYMSPRKAGHKQFMRQIREVLDRRIEVEVPTEALRKGLNVLALEVRTSPCLNARQDWPLGMIRFVTLDAEPADAVRSADNRSEGTKVWAEDIHRRVLTEEFLEPGVKARKVVRLVGVRGGGHSGQVLLGTTGKLASPSARLGDLSGPDGARIPASAAKLRWGRPVDIIETDKQEWALAKKRGGRVSNGSTDVTLFRYRKPVWDLRQQAERLAYPFRLLWWYNCPGSGRYTVCGKSRRDLFKAYGKGLLLFDPLSESAPGQVAAGSSQSLWITVEVPDDAKPGLYTSKLTVSAGGMKAADLAVRLQVFDWKVDPKKYKTYSGIEQSPWSLAKAAGVELWSEKHWELIEQSIKLCGKLGSRTACLAVSQDGEQDNGKDTMIKWVKKGDGAYSYDFSIADRYLKLWRKHCHAQSDVIVSILRMAKWDRTRVNTWPGTVVVVDPEAGRESKFTPLEDKEEVSAEGLKLWVDFCRATVAHLRKQGIPDSRIHFGTLHEATGDLNRALVDALREPLPGVGWARTSHYGGPTAIKNWGGEGVTDKVTWDLAMRSAARYGARHVAPFTVKKTEYKVHQYKSWRNPKAGLNSPFRGADVVAFDQPGALWALRCYPEKIMTTIYRGFGNFWLDGQHRRFSAWGPAFHWLVYPAAERVDGSITFEVLREGLQDAEARIYLEDKDALPDDVRNMLDRRAERVWHNLPFWALRGLGAEWYQGWQERSWDLYAAAARVAGGKVPSKEEKKRFFGK
jgi:hypothetical protein